MSEFETSRRNLLYGIAAAGAAVPVIAACGSSADIGTPSADVTGPGGATTEAPASGIPTSDIPVGGGAIYPDEAIVVTQPTEGTFKAFSTRCTHSGCPVDTVADGTIQCPCHGSRFSISDGSVQDGPARGPLTAKAVTLDGDTLTVS